MSNSPFSDTPAEADSLGSRLRADAAASASRLAELEAELDQLIHDPDVILEDRDSMRAMVESARYRALGAQQALDRFEAGGYGRCERCGGEISAERLEALPDATTCISCR